MCHAGPETGQRLPTNVGLQLMRYGFVPDDSLHDRLGLTYLPACHRRTEVRCREESRRTRRPRSRVRVPRPNLVGVRGTAQALGRARPGAQRARVRRSCRLPGDRGAAPHEPAVAVGCDRVPQGVKRFQVAWARQCEADHRSLFRRRGSTAKRRHMSRCTSETLESGRRRRQLIMSPIMWESNCHGSTGVRHRTAGDVVQTFCTSSRRPGTGRTRRRPGARGRCRCRSAAVTLTPGGWRGKREARRAAAERQTVDRWWWAGSRPGRAATSPRGVGERTPAASASGGGRGVAVSAPPAGALRLQDGRDTVGGSRSVGGCGRPSRLPSTRASRADHRPARQRPNVRQGRLNGGRAAARSPEGGSTADGMDLQHLSMQGTVRLTGILPEKRTVKRIQTAPMPRRG